VRSTHVSVSALDEQPIDLNSPATDEVEGRDAYHRDEKITTDNSLGTIAQVCPDTSTVTTVKLSMLCH